MSEDKMISLEFKATLNQLRKPLPEKLIKQRDGGGGSKLDYIEWTTASDVLDEWVGHYEVDLGKVVVVESADIVMLEVGITINGERRVGVGSNSISNLTKGGKPAPGCAFTNAYAQAFKRAAASWGIARTLYQDEDAQTIIRENDLKVRDLVTKLITIADDRGYTDAKLSSVLEKKYKEPNPFRLTLGQLTDAIKGFTGLPAKPKLVKVEEVA